MMLDRIRKVFKKKKKSKFRGEGGVLLLNKIWFCPPFLSSRLKSEYLT